MEQVQSSIVGSVKFFINSTKVALIKFYRIGQNILRSQEDNLDRWVTDYVLDSNVSWILFQIAK